MNRMAKLTASKVDFTSKGQRCFPLRAANWARQNGPDNIVRMDSTNTLGERLLEMLNEQQLTRAELARRAGMSRQAVGQIINGSNRGGIAAATLFALADALRVNPRWLLKGVGSKEAGQRIDRSMLASLIASVTAACEHQGANMDRVSRTSLAVDLYSLWERTGEHPDVAQMVELMRQR